MKPVYHKPPGIATPNYHRVQTLSEGAVSLLEAAITEMGVCTTRRKKTPYGDAEALWDAKEEAYNGVQSERAYDEP